MRKRQDSFHAEAVRALERVGCTVLDLSNVGGGCPDLLVGKQGVNVLLELKDPAKGTLTPDQVTWHRHWQGQKAIVFSVDECLLAVHIVLGLRTTGGVH